MLTIEEIDNCLFDLDGNQLYPQVELLINDRTHAVVKLFARDKTSRMSYGFEIPEKGVRIHYRIDGITRENGRLLSRSFCRM